jgi:ribonucleoside-diphosphate reductase alpha chain
MYEPKDFAEIIFKQRYAITTNETYEEACWRVAKYTAMAENGNSEKYAERFSKMMIENKFIPGGRIWYGSGRMKGQLLNCFVIPTEDTREGWGKAVNDMLIISGTGGGVGMNFSPIRPRGSPIRGTGGESTGAVSLMEIINQTGEVIKAGGGRRTALMQCLRYDHADIIEFLHRKFNKVDVNKDNLIEYMNDTYPNLPKDELDKVIGIYGGDFDEVIKSLIKYQLDQRLKNSNVSVLVDQKFFDSIENDEYIEFDWGGKDMGRVKAKEIWDIIINNSWESGEPGILNQGYANDMNNIWYHKKLVSTNPCGEIWLEEYGCCDLGAINLVNHIDSETNEIDWDSLADTVTLGVRFLDDVLDVNVYPLKKIEQNCQNVRRVGLGIMGLGHALIKLGLRYDNSEGRKMVDKIFNFIKKRAYESSTYLAAEKGSFPAFDADKFLESGFCKTLTKGTRAKIREYGIRNCAILTIAPTGTTSIMAATSSGIEPVFSAGYKRRYYASEDGSNERVIKEEIVIDPLFKDLYEQNYDLSAFVSAHEIDVEDHLRMQHVVQKHIDNAVSKTINLPNDYPIEKYGTLLLKYGPKLKGTTVYRSGSRGNEPLVPLTIEDAIKYLETQEVVVATAESDCPSGICEV